MERLFKYAFLCLLAMHGLVLSFILRQAYDSVFMERMVPADSRTFSVPDGASFQDVLQELYLRKLAPHPTVTRIALYLKNSKPLVKRGTYRLPIATTTWEIVQLLDQGKVQLLKLTLPEGLDKWQTLEVLAQSGWGDEDAFIPYINRPDLVRDWDPSATDLEGYLFPETYFFPQEATPEEIVQTLVSQFTTRTLPLQERLAASGLTTREWVSFASLVEKETSVPMERARIAGVFENRLNRGMLLQCDPTIIYSLKRENLYKGKIYRSQIKHDNPYNTYVYNGLPPGPIASPSLKAMEAVLTPESHNFLYFVAKKDGSHHFSRSLREHNQAVYKYLRSP